MSLPTDYHRLAEASHPTDGIPDAGALMGLADLLSEHGIPGAAFFSHLAQRAQSGEIPAGLHTNLANRYYDRTARWGVNVPRGIVIPSGEAVGWSIAPSRKRDMERTQDPMAQQIIGPMSEEQKQTSFGPAHPILAFRVPYKHSEAGGTTVATHYLPILSHAHAEEISRDWPDAERAKLLNYLAVSEGKNLPQDHNASEPTPADPNAPEHAGQPGKKARLARKKPKAATNELALAVRGGIKRALQDFAIDRGMPEELRGADFDRRAAAVEKELIEALKQPGGGRLAELRDHLTRSKVGAGGVVEFSTPASVAGLLSVGNFAGIRVLEALAAQRAEQSGKDYGAQIAHWNPKTTAPEKPKPSGFVELTKAQSKEAIASELADKPLVGAVKPPSDPGVVKPVDGRSFRSRANKTAAAQELPKPPFEVVPEPEAAPLPLANVDRPNSKHADAISAALFSPGDLKDKIARAHAALEALGMTNRGSRHRAIKQHIEARRAATKLARPKKPKVHAGATAAEITNKPGAARIDPQIAGTRLAYHLADLIREFKGDAGKAAHPERAGEIVTLAKDALLGKRDAYAKLGERLQAIGHPHGIAYNWHTISRSLRDDDLMKRFVGEQFAHAKGTGLMTDEVWRRVQKHYSLNSATAGSDAHNEFWKRATAYFKKHHGGDLRDLKDRINNSMFRTDKLRREAHDTAKEGVRGMRGTYYGDAGGEGQQHHMRFKRET